MQDTIKKQIQIDYHTKPETLVVSGMIMGSESLFSIKKIWEAFERLNLGSQVKYKTTNFINQRSFQRRDKTINR